MIHLMNRAQKNLLTNFTIVLVITIGFVVVLTNIRNSINISEGIRSMELLGKEALKYRQLYGSLPSESHLETIRKRFGIVRLGRIHYRAQWIRYGADEQNTILAYATEASKKFFQSYHIVLWLDGRVEQYPKGEFEKIRDEQQNEIEIEWLREHLLHEPPQMPLEPDIF